MLIIFPDNQNIIARCEILEKLLKRTKTKCARFYHNICIFDAFLSISSYLRLFVYASLFIFHILFLPHTSSLHWSSSLAQHTCYCLRFQRLCNVLMATYYTIQRLVIVCVSVHVSVCVYLFWATHCTQCCAYWVHLPRCTLNELWLLMNGGIVEERTKKFNDNSQKLAITTFLLYLSFLLCSSLLHFFLSFTFSFILFIRFSFNLYGLPKWQIQLKK